MALTVYGHKQSPFVRPVLMLLDQMGKEYKFEFVDLFQGAHRTPEYAKVSNRPVVPALVDGDFKLNESKAILVYLATKYDSSRKLYPENPEIQGRILESLFFETNDFTRAFMEAFVPLAFRGQKSVDQAKVDNLKKALHSVENGLKDNKFVAGTDDISVADISMLASYTSMRASGKTFVDFNEYPKLNEWEARCIKLVKNYEQGNGEGLEIFAKFFKAKVPQELQKF